MFAWKENEGDSLAKSESESVLLPKKVNIRKCLPASEKSASEIVRMESESENAGKKVTVKC